MMKLMLLTSNEKLIVEGLKAGVDIIFLDLEYINKKERQFGRDTVISNNSIDDVSRIRKIVPQGKLLVRVNPIHFNSKYEIDKVIENGADIIMLPMFTDSSEVRDFLNFVNGRAKTCLLFETAQALVRIDDILDVGHIDFAYIGLNDLHISLHLNFMFEPLSGGIVDYMAAKFIERNIPFGFGGMGKIGDGAIPAERILTEHYRLKSTYVILSRTFRNETNNSLNKPINLNLEIQKIRDEEVKNAKFSEQDFIKNRDIVKNLVQKFISGEK